MSNTMNIVMGAQRYENASMRAFWQEIIGQLRGRPAQLLSFDDVKARLRLHEESYRGLQDISLDAIVGSVGRYKDFTGTFLPKSAISKDRWSRIYAEMLGSTGLPPVEVYKVGEVYFVRDGNHRVSVSRELGAQTIQAYVTELDVPLCVSRPMLLRQMDAVEAYMAFLDESGLRQGRPGHEDLMLSEPTRYADLCGHLNLHGSALAEALGYVPAAEEVAAHWHDNVYSPVVRVMREYHVLDQARGRTEADMYLWLVDHLCELERQYTGQAGDLHPALAAFLEKRGLAAPAEWTAHAGPVHDEEVA